MECHSKRRLLFRILRTAALLTAGTFAGVLAGTLSPLWTIPACAGIIVLYLTCLKPDMALILFFCGIVMMSDAFSLTGGGAFVIPDADIIQGLPSMLTIFFLALFSITMIRHLVLEKRPLPVSLSGLVIYTVILCSAMLTGLLRNNDLIMLRVDFMDMLFPVLCFYLCITSLNSRERIVRLLTVLLAVAALKALILSVFYLAGRGWPYEPTYRIVTMDSADLLVFITLLLISLHLLVRRDVRGFQAGLIGAACLPMLFVIIFSYRRAQWIGFILSLGLLYLGSIKPVRRRLAVMLSVILCAGMLIAAGGGIQKENWVRIGSRIASIFDTTQHSNVHHKLEALQVLRELSYSPLFGLGLGGEHQGVEGYLTIAVNIVHNTFLYIWMKLGLPGLIFFVWAASRYGRAVLNSCKKQPDGGTDGLLLPLASSSGLWLAMFLTGPVPWYFHQTSLLALFAAMAMTLSRHPAGRAGAQPEVPE